MSRCIALVLLLSYLLSVPAAAAQPVPPTPPKQPDRGPGGAAYAYEEVVARHYGAEPDGTVDPTGYWLFEPEGPSSTAGRCPVALSADAVAILRHHKDAQNTFPVTLGPQWDDYGLVVPDLYGRPLQPTT